jgi:phosphohistidine phosphatase
VNLYLVRHADAVPAGTGGILRDDDRPLSEEGVQQVKGLADVFRRLGVVPDRFVTSPLVRARQTAEGLLGQLDLSAETLVECKALAPDGSSKKLAKFLRKLGVGSAVLVGHEPDLGQHAAWFLGSRKARIGFAKGSAAWIVCDRDPGQGAAALRWLVTPQLFGMRSRQT